MFRVRPPGVLSGVKSSSLLLLPPQAPFQVIVCAETLLIMDMVCYTHTQPNMLYVFSLWDNTEMLRVLRGLGKVSSLCIQEMIN